MPNHSIIHNSGSTGFPGVASQQLHSQTAALGSGSFVRGFLGPGRQILRMLWSSAEVGARAGGFAQRLSVLQEPSVNLLQGSFPLCCAWKWVLSARGSPRRVLAVGEVGRLLPWVCFQFHP